MKYVDRYEVGTCAFYKSNFRLIDLLQLFHFQQIWRSDTCVGVGESR